MRTLQAALRALRAGMGDVAWWVYPVSVATGAALGAVMALFTRRRGSGDGPLGGLDLDGGVVLVVFGLGFLAVLVAGVIYTVRINTRSRAARFDRAYSKRAERIDQAYAENTLVQDYGHPDRRDPIPEQDRSRAVDASERQIAANVPITVGTLVATPFFVAALIVTAHLVYGEIGRLSPFSAALVPLLLAFVQLGRARLVLERERRVPPAPAVEE